MGTFRELIIWEKSMALVTSIYITTKCFPKDEMFGLTSQLRRCSVSIPSNIAEGFGRNSDTEFSRFLTIANGSLYELQTQLQVALNVGYLQENDFNVIYGESRELEAILSSFSKKVKERITRTNLRP